MQRSRLHHCMLFKHSLRPSVSSLAFSTSAIHHIFLPHFHYQNNIPSSRFFFVSRDETHTELLQQVILFVAEVNFTNYTDFAQFLRSLLTYTMIQNSVSTAYTCFAQRLHSLLVSLSCTHPSQGLWIFKILVECITFYPQQTPMQFLNAA